MNIQKRIVKNNCLLLKKESKAKNKTMIKLNFKSKSPFFEKERDGIKPNTFRQLGDNDSRFDELMQIIQTKEEAEITIFNPVTKETFTRRITDVTYYEGWFIISWKHQEIFIGKIRACHETEFHGIDCLEMEDEYGFEGYYMGDIDHPDHRPGHAIWIKKKDAEKLFKLFNKK
jgi:hypothetical protein